MMNRNPDILFLTEYIKNLLYFATVRQGKIIKSSNDVHYFTIDNELVYENYYSDFGPLNIGCVYKYCKLLNDKLSQYLNKQSVVHYTSIDPKKKANAAFLLGCYGVLYLNLSPRDALKPLMLHGQSYRPFQDATQGDSVYTITLIDCLQAFKKARDLRFFNFQDFNLEEYERLDKIQGGDLNWIVPGKFLAFIGPVDYNVSLYHPPEMYIEYFRETRVQVVIRLNKKMYDAKVFRDAGIIHYDLFFPDGSCPPRHILFKFLQISEECSGAVAVHCKAGLGRTGSLIGTYLIKHYRMTAHEAIGWMRICRPGSVIGHQQGWLEQLEPWLLKQGTMFRKRNYQNSERLPVHEFGIYSLNERAFRRRQSTTVYTRPPTSSIQRPTHSDTSSPIRKSVASRVVEEKLEIKDGKTEEESERYLTSCDLTETPTASTTHIKGCVIKNSSIHEHYDVNDRIVLEGKRTFWKKCFRCRCHSLCLDGIFLTAVRCVSCTQERFQPSCLCTLVDSVAANQKRDTSDWTVRTVRKGTKNEASSTSTISSRSVSRPTASRVGAGEPRAPPTPTFRYYPVKTPSNSSGKDKVKANDLMNRKCVSSKNNPIPTYHAAQSHMIKNLNDAKNYLLRAAAFKEKEPCKPKYDLAYNLGPYTDKHDSLNRMSNSVLKGPIPVAYQRRRLGRSPSPSPSCSPTRYVEQNRATNTPPTHSFKAITKDSKAQLKEALSRLRLAIPRDGSVGAASLGAQREAPQQRNIAASVRSDERPIATQGDMLNSIKYQRRLRETIIGDKESVKSPLEQERNKFPKEQFRDDNVRSQGGRSYFNIQRDKATCSTSTSKGYQQNSRPSSPKGRTRTQTYY